MRTWEYIADDLRNRIVGGQWAEGDQLPTQRELMAQYGVSNSLPVVRAMRTLEAQGLVLTDPQAPRKGRRVRANHKLARQLSHPGRYEQAEYERDVQGGLFEQATGHTQDLHVAIRYDWLDEAPPEIAAILHTGQVLARRFSYSIKGTPHQIATSFMPAGVARKIGLLTPDSEKPGHGTIAWLYDGGIKITERKSTLRTRLPTPQESDELRSIPGFPIFEWSHALYQGKDVIETGGAIVSGSQIEYTTTDEFY